MCSLLGAIADVLHSLRLLNVKTSNEEVESMVMRSFLEGRLDPRKGMTTYEVTYNVACLADNEEPHDLMAPGWLPLLVVAIPQLTLSTRARFS